MSDDIPFNRDFDAAPGQCVRLSPLVRRILANNPSPFTFKGTCTYVVGNGTVALIDPGPDDPAHVESLRTALKDEKIAALIVTHTHRDHSPAARILQQTTSAPIIGCGPYIPARELALGETNALEASNDLAHHPDHEMRDRDVYQGDGFTLACVATPGHTMNHLAFALHEENGLFSGDHVMGWSTTIVAPPDGAMAPYMASLDKLLAREDNVYWPGHGAPITEPQKYVAALARHRRARESAILARLQAGDQEIAVIVATIYKGLDPRLANAAGLSVFAHLEDMVARGLAATDGTPSLTSLYRTR